jgi:predicted transcriptional regulator
MDSAAIGHAVLMSIRPVFAEAILRGDKRVEFRKRPLAARVTHVIVYATLPVGAITGAFSVAGQKTCSPAGLWQTFGGIAGIESNAFWQYFDSHSEGTGIFIGEVFVAYQPLAIDKALGFSRPPQSYQYIDTDSANRLLRTMQPALA